MWTKYTAGALKSRRCVTFSKCFCLPRSLPAKYLKELIGWLRPIPQGAMVFPHWPCGGSRARPPSSEKTGDQVWAPRALSWAAPRGARRGRPVNSTCGFGDLTTRLMRACSIKAYAVQSRVRLMATRSSDFCWLGTAEIYLILVRLGMGFRPKDTPKRA